MAISRLQASLASATNELTVAAAAINLDFTLFKIDAPKEFHALGEHLSKKRKHDAETGTTHVTARRLGALFENICPATPKLVKAYGTRVSEISAIASARTSSESANSIFSAHSGVDGTSIWAAATSSSTALQIQLLACMLARVWSGPEATSVWVELIKERKAEIAALFQEEESIHFSILKAATQLEMPRSQLADWDASARSWLQTADTVKSHEQKQLMLILDNINLPVNNDMKVYSSVIAAWKSALETMERLIDGQPQATSNGSTLLALHSWHLYPDILVQGSSSAEVLMNDPLVAPGSVLTLGLQRPRAEDERRGVYWSLSLAHLRHYGRPVHSEGSLSNESARVTFTQFRLAAFGAFLNRWHVFGTGTALAAQFFTKVEAFFEQNALLATSPAGIPSSTVTKGNAVRNSFTGPPRDEDEDKDEVMEDVDNGDTPPDQDDDYRSSEHVRTIDAVGKALFLEYFKDSAHWMHHFADAAQAYLSADGGRDKISNLVNLGLRRPDFFGEKIMVEHSPYFGLSRPTTLLSCLAGLEEQISYLRRVAGNLNRGPANMIIRYVVNGCHAYATATPRQQKSFERRTLLSDPVNQVRHYRWFKHDPSLPDMGMVAEGEVCKISQTDDFLLSPRGNHIVEVKTAPGVWTEYSLFFGDVDSAALFSPLPCDTDTGHLTTHEPRLAYTNLGVGEIHTSSWIPYAPTVEDVLWCLDADLFSAHSLLSQILHGLDPLGEVARTLDALSVVSRVYKLLPDATISLNVLNQPIAQTQWAKDLYQATAALEGQTKFRANEQKFKFNPSLLKRGAAISCIAYLESGYCDVQPGSLSNVFALSTGDSIYVAMPLLCDPYQMPQEYELKRILGNVGRAGITMLIPPKDPMLRESQPDAWKVMNNVAFDGSAEDHFKRTSLHLSFTEYTLPVYDGYEGLQDNQVSFLESVVSVYDSGEWVGDIDVLNAVQSPTIRRMPPTAPCSHANGQNPGRELISIQTWDEVLDRPNCALVVCANGNWIARLAITSVLVQKYAGDGSSNSFFDIGVNSVTICPFSVCWRCLHPELQDRSHGLDALSHAFPMYVY